MEMKHFMGNLMGDGQLATFGDNDVTDLSTVKPARSTSRALYVATLVASTAVALLQLTAFSQPGQTNFFPPKLGTFKLPIGQ
jgi:hypothetical protein